SELTIAKGTFSVEMLLDNSKSPIRAGQYRNGPGQSPDPHVTRVIAIQRRR
ncbi:MAG: hypothetical protein QOF78_277, partial [Phycisphaerales bacterium]|nr:hypothetical protein [Phycisphaerales bacterium]